MTIHQYDVSHHLEEEVNIKAIDQRAVITQICIAGKDATMPSHMTFECVWYANGVRQSAWLHSFEIESAPEPPAENRPGFC